MAENMRSDLRGNPGEFFPLIHAKDYYAMNCCDGIQSEEQWKVT